MEGLKSFSDKLIAFLDKALVQTVKLLFMMAEMLGTIYTAQTGVCILKIALGSEVFAQFPAQQEQRGKPHKNIGQRVAEEYQRCEHHYEVPVIYPAAAAAFVHHHPALERTEKEYANHVADRVGKRNQDKHAPVDKALEIKNKDTAIKNEPENKHRTDGFKGAPSQLFSVKITAGAVVLAEVLLASHALQSGGEEAQQNLKRKNHRVYEREGSAFKTGKHAAAIYFAQHIKKYCQQEHKSSAKELEIMHKGGGGELHEDSQRGTHHFLFF